MTYPCGRCPECCKRRTSHWSFRLMQEEKVSFSSLFLTLTYDTAKLDEHNFTPNGLLTICKRHPQLFMKRLRKLNSTKLTYYLVGEYGGRFNRPHYHVILFNADVRTIQDAWTYGAVHYGFVSGASVGYTLKYISKGRTAGWRDGDDRCPEFSLMSKGIGENYLTPQMRKWHLDDLENRMCVPLEGGKIASMPRYYRDKLYSPEQRKRVEHFNKWRMIMKNEETLTKVSSRDLAEAHIQQFKTMKYHANI